MLTHMIATGWAGFQISHTAQFQRQFTRVTTNGACMPLDLLPCYWKERGQAELSILALNIVALVISAILTWKLIKVGFRTLLHLWPCAEHERFLPVVWVADLQTHGSFISHQPLLQDCFDFLDHYPAVNVLHARHCLPLA
jgi:hypothetical protein